MRLGPITNYSWKKVWGVVFHHWGYTRESCTPLPPNSLGLHQTQKRQDEILDWAWIFISLSNTDIPRNSLATFPRMFGSIPRNVWQHSLECLRTFPGMSDIWGHSPECLATFPGIFEDIPQNATFSPFPTFPEFCSPLLYFWFYT